MGREVNEVFLQSSYRGKKYKGYDQLCDWYFHDFTRQRSLYLCANRAYRDLCRNLAGLSKMDAGKKKAWREETQAYIAKRVTKLFEKAPDAYHGWHHQSCEGIMGIAGAYQVGTYLKLGFGFTYGLAQKWLNMTVKNACIMEKWDDLLEPFLPVCHVPVDSYIMEAASGLGISVAQKNGKLGAYREGISKPWSQWDGREYAVFQKELHKTLSENMPGVTPLGWEASAWLQVKRTREGKNMKTA